jgi:hypothetical protein
MFGGLMKSYSSRQAAPSADRFSGGLPVPAIHIDLSDGFDHDDVVLHVNNREAARGSDVTTNLTVSHAASFDVLRPVGEPAASVQFLTLRTVESSVFKQLQSP